MSHRNHFHWTLHDSFVALSEIAVAIAQCKRALNVKNIKSKKYVKRDVTMTLESVFLGAGLFTIVQLVIINMAKLVEFYESAKIKIPYTNNDHWASRLNGMVYGWEAIGCNKSVDQ